MEALQKISDAPLKQCPKCKESALKKLISAAAFRLKGTGWYETDFKNSGKKDDSADKQGKVQSKEGDKQKKDSPDASSGASGEKAAPAKSESSTSSKASEGTTA